MAFYETTIIARQDLSRPDLNKLVESLGAILENGGGKLVKSEFWGLRSLAYKIEKNRKGNYVMLAIDAPAEAQKEMERNIRLNEDVIRMLTIRVDALEEGPSAMMQQARSRDDVPSEEQPAVDVA